MSIYAIRSDTGLIKVGITDGEPRRRMASLQTGNPHKLDIVGFIDTENYGVDHRKLEAVVHERLARFHSIGEWFSVPNFTRLRLVAMGRGCLRGMCLLGLIPGEGRTIDYCVVDEVKTIPIEHIPLLGWSVGDNTGFSVLNKEPM